MILKYFTPSTPEQIVQNQMMDARRLVLEHEAAAEHHSALARMYRLRVQRLSETERQDRLVTAK